ncbi:MAG: integrase/recombinase XerC, partial [Chloroflexi bacterium]|nr:integrase/recombinase XerC [Chloroflexota bacterium]
MSKKPSDNQKDELKELIEVWLDSCRIDDLSQRTIQDYSEKVMKFYWWWNTYTKYSSKLGLHPRNVRVSEAREFASYLKTPQKDRWGNEGSKNLSSASVVSYGRTVKVFFSWLEREGFIDQNPFNKSVHFHNRHKKDLVIKNVSSEKL